MHDIRYNDKTDEISVTNPFAQAILTFKGDAGGAASPIRIIQGPKTELGSEDTLAIDSTNGEIYIEQGDGVRVYPVAGNGDVAPLRHAHRAKGVRWSIGGGIEVDPIHNVVVTDGTLTGDLAKKYPWDNPYRGGRDTL